jgi:hypothetical protein
VLAGGRRQPDRTRAAAASWLIDPRFQEGNAHPGTPLDESRVRKIFRAGLDNAELSGFRVYDSRSATRAHHDAPVVRALERFVDGLAGPKAPKSGTRTAKRGHQLSTKTKSGAPAATEAPDKFGGPSRTRTLDPLIKRHRRDMTGKHSDALNPQQFEL